MIGAWSFFVFSLQINPVTHGIFPSGLWTSSYNYSPKDKHRMDLNLTFTTGKMTSDGCEDNCAFSLTPGPLPLGEGESFPVSPELRRL